MLTPDCLREARKREGLTQEQLAVKAGLAAATIRNIESGRHPPSTRTLKRLRLVIELGHNCDGSEAEAVLRPPNGGAASAKTPANEGEAA